MLLYGQQAMHEVETNGKEFTTEMNMKFQCIEKLRKVTTIGNTKRIAMENELSSSTMSISTFCELCLVEQLHVLVVYYHERSFYEIGDSGDLQVVRISNKGEVCIETNTDGAAYMDVMYKLPDEKKRLYAISAYKRNELHDICKRVGLEVDNSSLTKVELYDKLTKHFQINNQWRKLT